MPIPSYRRLAPALLFLAAAVTACAPDATAPAASTRLSATAPRLLLEPGEFNRTIADSTDAAGNQIFVTEYAAGFYNLADGTSASVASVTVRTVIPATSSGSSSDVCLTSSVVSTETTVGWKATVKKPGGCNKEIVVELENSSTREKAEFRYLFIPGKTRIDQGRVS